MRCFCILEIFKAGTRFMSQDLGHIADHHFPPDLAIVSKPARAMQGVEPACLTRWPGCLTVWSGGHAWHICARHPKACATLLPSPDFCRNRAHRKIGNSSQLGFQCVDPIFVVFTTCWSRTS